MLTNMSCFLAILFLCSSRLVFPQTDTIATYDNECESGNPHEIDTTYFTSKKDTLFIRDISRRQMCPELIGLLEVKSDTFHITTVDTSKGTCLAACSYGYTFKILTTLDTVDVVLNEEHFLVTKKAVGLKERTSKQSIKLYPNPTSHTLNIDLKGKQIRSRNGLKLRVVDQNGRVIRRQKLNSDINAIRMDQIDSGLYFYQIISGEERLSSGKFVVQ